MPSTNELRRRIRSVKGTQQITKAMKMVAAAKLRRAQQRMIEARPYADALTRVLASLASRTEHSHPLLESRTGGRTWLVVVTSDKGLCGSFNANLLRRAERELRQEAFADTSLVAVGRKASDFFRRRDWELVHEERDMISNIGPDDGAKLGQMCIKAFESGQVDNVWLFYNRFINLIRHESVLERVLPIEAPKVETGSDQPAVDYLYEPDAEGLLGALLPRQVEVQLRRALYETSAAEQAARMTAMGAATKNAGEMIDALTLLYNRTRQAAITKELIEIVSGAQALGE